MGFPTGWAKFAINEVAGIIKEAADVVTLGESNYIRDGEPQGVVAGLNLDAARRACRRYARKVDQLDSREIARWDSACRPYLESIGEYPGPPVYVSPYQGGQCDGVPYSVRVPYTNLVGDGQVADLSGFGPVLGARVTILSDTSFRVDATLRLTPGGGLTNAGIGPVGYQAGTTVGPLTVVRTDGQPDECGSPPPEYEKPTPIPTPLPPFRPTIPGIDVDVDVDINLDGDITIIFDPGGDETVVGPTDPFEPDPSTDPFGPQSPGDRGEPGPGIDISDGQAGTGEAEEGEILVGVEVEVLSTDGSPREQKYLDYSVWRQACYVYLGSGASLDQQPEAAALISPQFFFAPPGSTTWIVYSGLGYNLRVTPYYREVKEDL